MRVVLCLRGISGCGKSSFAQLLKSLFDNTIIVEADNFFINDKGEYKFDSKLLFEAHSRAKAEFLHAINNKVELVIISNTSCKADDVKYYQEKALTQGYKFFSIVMEKRHEGNNTHSVPIQTINRQKDQLKNSLKLI